MTERRERSFDWIRFLLFQLVLGVELGPRRGHRGDGEKVSRDVEEGISGPEAFNLLLRRLMTHFNRVDTGEGDTRLHSFGVHGDPFLRF